MPFKAPQLCHLRRNRRRTLPAAERLVWEGLRILMRRCVGGAAHFHREWLSRALQTLDIFIPMFIIVIIIIVTIIIIIILHDYQVINRHADHQQNKG